MAERHIAIMLNGNVVSRPQVNSVIEDGVSIPGSEFSETERKERAVMLSPGENILPIPVRMRESRVLKDLPLR